MRRSLALALAAPAAMVAAVAAAPQPARSVAAQQDWTRTVSATPEGGFRVGNPQAPVKLVEYGSLTCAHCAAFAAEGVPKLLARHVKAGKVSFEFRNFIRDPADLTAALLTRCAGPTDYFALTHSYFETQKEWLQRYIAMTAAQRQAVDALPQEQKLIRFAAQGGLDKLAAKAGISPARANQCLTDPKALAKLVEMRKVAVESHGLQGTPHFLINGKVVEAHNWAQLEPLLGPPGG